MTILDEKLNIFYYFLTTYTHSLTHTQSPYHRSFLYISYYIRMKSNVIAFFGFDNERLCIIDVVA